MDAVHIMQDNVKKAIEVWVDGGDDDNGGISGKNGNSSDERNEKD